MRIAPASVRYREYEPSKALRGHIRALFSFTESTEEYSTRPVLLDVKFDSGERVCAPTFADVHCCIVFTFAKHYCPDGAWREYCVVPRGHAMGPMTSPGPPTVPERAECIGAYFRAGAGIPGIPAVELENRVVALEGFCGEPGRRMAEELCDSRSEASRIDCLESALIQRIDAARRSQTTSLEISRLAAWVVESAGQLPGRTARGCGRFIAPLFRTSVPGKRRYNPEDPL